MLQDLLYKYFDLFSQKLSGRTCQVRTEITSFLKLLSKQEDLQSLGDWFAWNYVAFQFEYYSSLKTKMDGKYPANWIFGKKALERWNNKNEDHWLYYVQIFLSNCGIEKPVEFCSLDIETRFEQERKRFFNTDLGLIHCLQFSRYSAKSPSCMICENRKDCKVLWK